MSADDLASSFDRPEAVGSVRVCVARAALRAALGVPGVLGADSGPSGLRLTADPPSGPLFGVLATAQADGRYAVDLSLVAEMVPLPELAEEVRGRVRTRARVEQLEDVLGSINVEFVYVATAEEVAVAAAEKRVEEAAESATPESGGVEGEIPEAAAAQERARPANQGEQRLRPFLEATPPGPDAAALAAQQAALATDQAALAAKQAALAAEQAALAALPGPALPSLGSERAAGSVAEDAEERER